MHLKISLVDPRIRYTAGLAVVAWLTGHTPTGLFAAPRATGTLAVASDPAGAVVYVDGQFVGLTPLSVRELAPGDHRVRLVKDGYLENSRLLTVPSGRIGTIHVLLTARPTAKAARSAQAGDDAPPAGSGGLSTRKSVWMGVAGGGAAAAVLLIRGRNHVPMAGNVMASPSTGLQSSTTISFSVQASDQDDDPLTYSWDFGDSAAGTGQTTTHVYMMAGTFTVRVTVSDGRASASSQTAVTVRALTGTWRSNSVAYRFQGVSQGTMQWATILTQSGATVSGTVQAVGAISQLSSPGTIIGSVGSSSPIVTLVGNVPGWLTPTFTLDPGVDVNTLTGRWTDSSSSQPIAFTRQ